MKVIKIWFLLFNVKSINGVNDTHQKGQPQVPCRKGWDTFRLTQCCLTLYVKLVHGVVFTRRF